MAPMPSDPTVHAAVDVRADLIASLVGPPPRTLLIIGGRGKTSLARSAFDDVAVREHFADRRHWVAAGQVRSLGDLLAAMAVAVALPPVGSIGSGVLEYLRGALTLLVIDDLDVTSTDDVMALDEFAADLERIPTVVILATAVSQKAAFSLPWTTVVRPGQESRGDREGDVAADAGAIAMTTADPAVREFVSLMAALADGASAELLAHVPGGRGLADEGLRAGLLVEHDGRVRVAPGSLTSIPPAPVAPSPLREGVSGYLFALAEQCAPLIGKQGGREAVGRLVSEVRNIEAAVRWGLGDDNRRAIAVAANFANFMRHTGVGDQRLLTEARAAAQATGPGGSRGDVRGPRGRLRAEPLRSRCRRSSVQRGRLAVPRGG